MIVFKNKKKSRNLQDANNFARVMIGPCVNIIEYACADRRQTKSGFTEDVVIRTLRNLLLDTYQACLWSYHTFSVSSDDSRK